MGAVVREGPFGRPRAVVIAAVGSGGIAVLFTVFALAPWRSAAPAAWPLVAPAPSVTAPAPATLSPVGSENLPPESVQPPEPAMAPPLGDSPPPCSRYYPACGKFSAPGVVADLECGCRADETCVRTTATGTCVRRPRWLGPQN